MGNKIILPQSALDHLARLNISYPMLFEVMNPSTNRKTHCGVQEFIAEEGMCYLPYWMMGNLLLQEGDLIRVTNTSLPKGSFVKLQPVSSDFLDIHNPRAVLENSLRNFATLTVGDIVALDYNNKKYEIEIIECKPANAISIIEADVNVDFAPPKDYQEPERPVATTAFTAKEEAEDPAPMEDDKFKTFGGQGQRVDGKAIKTPLSSPAAGPKPPPNVEDELDEKMPWRKRIKAGVKWNKQPFAFGVGHMTGTGGTKGAVAPADALDINLWDGDGNSLQ